MNPKVSRASCAESIRAMRAKRNCTYTKRAIDFWHIVGKIQSIYKGSRLENPPCDSLAAFFKPASETVRQPRFDAGYGCRCGPC